MAMAARDIGELIRNGIPDADVAVSDLRGDGEQYAVRVVSEAFRGKDRVTQHRMVYDALRGVLSEEMQALTLHTALPDKKRK